MAQPPCGGAADPSSRNEALAGWLTACAQGNARAFEQFYQATAGQALLAVRRITGDAHAEDVLADAYLQAWRDSHRFDPTRGTALAWLLTIARSRALDRLRQEALRHGGLYGAPAHEVEHEESGSPPPDELLGKQQEHARIHALLAQLPANERWVLSLAYFRELTQTEIASQTGMPLGTVKSLMLRGQHRLRGAMVGTPAPAVPRSPDAAGA